MATAARARLATLARTFVRMTADLHNAAAPDSHAKVEALRLHTAAVGIARELGIKGDIDPHFFDGEAVRLQAEVRRLRAEVKRLEGGGQPAKVAAARAKIVALQQALQTSRADERRLRRVINRVFDACYDEAG